CPAPGATATVERIRCEPPDRGGRAPLWQTAFEKGIVYGSSAATWQRADREYRRLFAREAAILFTEDDRLGWRLRPTPQSELDFRYADRIVEFAEERGMLVLGAHLVWDQGFGEGWTESDLWGIDERRARELLFGTIDRVVRRYRGRVAGWIVVNEALDGSGLRAVPWSESIGPSYVAESFERAHEADPEATLVLNDFGYETDDDYTVAADKRDATLTLLDELLGEGVPVHALGVQAHLGAHDFAKRFDAPAYRRFLAAVADRGLDVLITELDVLDDGLPEDVEIRDRAVAEAFATYLDAALAERAVRSLLTFGLSDRYTWLEEDYPRSDGRPRRPLPFDERLRPKPAYDALARALANAAPRNALWRPPRC
ncbi:MAG: endo-1,4-beta-xylanase, partial [Actinobacteria bacterium]|nr:endo-1,4-beta-xylanase [Actinomycetota bacterium]